MRKKDFWNKIYIRFRTTKLNILDAALKNASSFQSVFSYRQNATATSYVRYSGRNMRGNKNPNS
jgi:hypothetical protein